jgi:hypothetical protein
VNFARLPVVCHGNQQVVKRDRIEFRHYLEWRAHREHHGAARSGGFGAFNSALDRPAVARITI